MIMIGVGILIAVVLVLLLGIPYIHLMKKKMYSQYLKDVMAELHKGKEKTPTTGGVFIVLSIIIASVITLFMAQQMTKGALILLMTLFFFAITGFQDDFKKIKGHKNDGLSAKGKLALQIAVSLLPAFYVMETHQTTLSFLEFSINIGYFYPIFAVFMIVGSSNAVNLTDGLDGLAASCSVPAFLACSILAFLKGNLDVAIVSAITAAACGAFLYYNKKPAQIFMGDTGSLALGGLLATISVVGKFELYLIPIAFIFISETLSVMIQVTSYKFFNKRRVFKMTPIHHHFELSSWSENKIVRTFAFVSFMTSILTIIAYFLYLMRSV